MIVATRAGSPLSRAHLGTATMSGGVGPRIGPIGGRGRRLGAEPQAVTGTGVLAAAGAVLGAELRLPIEATAAAAAASPLSRPSRPSYWVWPGSRASRNPSRWRRSQSSGSRLRQRLGKHIFEASLV